MDRRNLIRNKAKDKAYRETRDSKRGYYTTIIDQYSQTRCKIKVIETYPVECYLDRNNNWTTLTDTGELFNNLGL